MRTQEILDVLVKGGTVKITVTEESCTVWIHYSPYTSRKGKTLFDAAFQVVKYLADSLQAPQAMREAMEAYDRHTESLI